MTAHPPRNMGTRCLDVPLTGPFRPLNQPRKTTTKAAPQAATDILGLQGKALRLEAAILEERVRLAEQRQAAAARRAEETSWEVAAVTKINAFGDIQGA